MRCRHALPVAGSAFGLVGSEPVDTLRERLETAVTKFCKPMNSSSSTPTAMRVHHEFRSPWKLIRL